MATGFASWHNAHKHLQPQGTPPHINKTSRTT